MQIVDTRPLLPQAVGFWSFNALANGVAANQAGAAGAATFTAARGVALTTAGPGAAQAAYGAGSAAAFNGADYATVADAPAMQLKAGTIQFWVNANATRGWQTLLSKASAGDGASLQIGLDGDSLKVAFGQGGGATVLSSSQRLSAGVWYNVAVTFGPGGAQLYVNGALAAQTLTPASLVGNHDALVFGASLTFGRFGQATINNGFKGALDEMTILDGVLTPAQIAAVIAAGPAAYVAQAKAAGGIDGAVTLSGFGLVDFGDGTVAYVLGAGSSNLPILSAGEARSLAGGGRLTVLGDGSQTLTLAGPWTSQGTQTIGATTFAAYRNGPASVLVASGVPVTVNAALTIPTVRAQVLSTHTDRATGAFGLRTLATGAVTFEAVDPTQLIALIRNSSAAPSLATPAAKTLVFDEATGTLREAVPAAAGAGASLMIDGFGEEWLFVAGVLNPGDTTPSRTIRI